MLNLIGAGFGRTGTTSLKAALEHLGFGPCYHMFELVAEPERIEHWVRAANGEKMDWNTVFDGYQSTLDWPGCAFWEELLAANPRAKVILTVRDPQRWYESTHKTIYQMAQGQADSAADPVAAKLFTANNKLIWNGTFGGRFDDQEHAIRVFEEHNERVRRTVPADQLLEFQVSQGWGPLCEFLGVDAPEVDFPHVNDAASVPELVAKVREQGRVPSPFTA